jgi:outer membrane murein-binding lipoprotein Lpp
MLGDLRRIFYRCGSGAALQTMRVRAFYIHAILASVLLCAGCSSSSNVDVMVFANPGKYEYHTCDQISAAGKTLVAREAVLRDLIEKAEQGAAGALVSTIAYRGEHRSVVEELGVIEAAAKRKKCATPATWRSNTAIQ